MRKALYSGALMAATASVCYPYQAVKITKAEYEALRAFWRDSVGGGVIDRVSERMGRGTNKVRAVRVMHPYQTARCRRLPQRVSSMVHPINELSFNVPVISDPIAQPIQGVFTKWT